MKALQGHPEAGVLWERMIVGILKDLNFRSTTHERNLYRAEIDGKLVESTHSIKTYAMASAEAVVSNLVSAVCLCMKGRRINSQQEMLYCVCRGGIHLVCVCVCRGIHPHVCIFSRISFVTVLAPGVDFPQDRM
jgi:hypothetical protein